MSRFHQELLDQQMAKIDFAVGGHLDKQPFTELRAIHDGFGASGRLTEPIASQHGCNPCVPLPNGDKFNIHTERDDGSVALDASGQYIRPVKTIGAFADSVAKLISDLLVKGNVHLGDLLMVQ